MMQDNYCYYNLKENRCKCGANKGEHENCLRFLPSDNGRPCAHFRVDHDGACDNAYACSSAYAAALKME